jgi:hypothetical protein
VATQAPALDLDFYSDETLTDPYNVLRGFGRLEVAVS